MPDDFRDVTDIAAEALPPSNFPEPEAEANNKHYIHALTRGYGRRFLRNH